MSHPTYRSGQRGGLVYDRILPAVPSSVGIVRRELDLTLHRLDAPAQLRTDIALVATEAVANVVMHAYVDMPRGPVYAAAEVRPDALVIAVGDAGRGLIPRLDTPGLGFGLPLMGRLCEDLVVTRQPSGTGTQVTATFRHRTAPLSVRFDRERRDSLHEYVRAMVESAAETRLDTRALVAEADQALRRGAQLRRAFLEA
jgi:serine/threonine-protein kinase RsbW/stage II sporulation protein AB (anti-sigma F factor)